MGLRSLFRSRSFWLGLGVSTIFIALFLFTVELKEMGEALVSADYLYVVPAVLIYFVAVMLRSMRWKYLLSPISEFTAVRLFPVVTVGYMANNLLPARIGEVIRAYYLGRRENFSTSTALATIMVERVYDGLTLLLLAVVAVPFLMLSGLVNDSSNVSVLAWSFFGAAAVLVFIAAIILLTFLAVYPGAGPLLDRFTFLIPARFRSRVGEYIDLFLEGLSVLRERRRHFGLIIMSLPVWLSEGAMYLLIALSFDLGAFFEPPVLIVPVVLLVTTASNLGTALPSAPGAIGTFEFPAVSALVLVGVAEGVAGAYAIMLHVALLLPVTALGLLFLGVGNVSLRNLISGEDGHPPHYPLGQRLERTQDEKRK